MNRDEKRTWMAVWAAEHDCQVTFEGECGFGRECVGILKDGTYPDYEAGSVWAPEDAYHKHDCVAVLGRGEEAEGQLYDWLKWFDDHGYTVEESSAAESEEFQDLAAKGLGALAVVLGKHRRVAMVKRVSR